MALRIRSFVMNAITQQFRDGDNSIDTLPIIEAVMADEALARTAVTWAVEVICKSHVGRAIRERMVHDEKDMNDSATKRLVNAIVDYGLSLLDVKFGSKKLGDYLPSEAVAYAGQQHEAARKMAIHARFIAGVAKACSDDTKPIREQVTNEEVEAIRRSTIDSSPNKEVAEIVLAVA